MNKRNEILWDQKQTNPVLLKAHSVLTSYAKATNTIVSITDQNHLSIPEMFNDSIVKKNTCLFCLKYKYNLTVNKIQDYVYHPCRNLHIEGIKKAYMCRGIYNYRCELGFVFWISPIYTGKKYMGAFISGGLLSADREETAKKMENLCRGAIPVQDHLEYLSAFPLANARQIKALSELLQVCAESVVQDNSDMFETSKRRNGQQNELTVILEKIKEKYSGVNGINSAANAGINRTIPEYPLENENEFLDAVRSGNPVKAAEILNELLGMFIYMSAEQFENVRLRIFELAVLLSRTDNMNGAVSYAFANSAYQFLKAIEKAGNPQELIDTIHLMTRYMTNEAFSYQGIRHVSLLKKADRYIQANFTRKISLDEIAEAAGLSAPYFSTVFKEEMGENLTSYLNRLRVEKACQLLSDTNQSLGDIAYSCGFKDQSWFSKIFKNYIGVNPAKFRQNRKNQNNAVLLKH